MPAACSRIAYRMNYISADRLSRLAASMGRSPYGDYLCQLVEQDQTYAD